MVPAGDCALGWLGGLGYWYEVELGDYCVRQRWLSTTSRLFPIRKQVNPA